MEYFNEDGHLTEDALTELVYGEPEELHRLEIAEHLSFCDECLERYTWILSEPALISPAHSVIPKVTVQMKNRAKRTFLSRYGTMAVAACFAMMLWVTGSFQVGENFLNKEIRKDFERDTIVKLEFYEKMDQEFNKIIDNIYDWKGVFKYGK